LHVGPKTIKCVQHPGEAIYVPSGWGHAVRNHGDSFALATEYSASGLAADMSMTERLKSAEMRGYARPPWSMDKPLLR
jgi:oxalate decarboxylase/phosphoglucose isomerase-like protein (cupin superfamily)